MLINCDVWKQNGELVRCGGLAYNRMWKEREVIDTDLFDFFTGVTIIKQDYGYPYANQCMVSFKEKGKYPLIIDVDTMTKIRKTLEKDVLTI